MTLPRRLRESEEQPSRAAPSGAQKLRKPALSLWNPGYGFRKGRDARGYGAASGGNGFRKGLGVSARGGPCEWEMSGGGRAGGSKVRSVVAVEAERAAPGSVGFPCWPWPGLMGTARVVAAGVEQGVFALFPCPGTERVGGRRRTERAAGQRFRMSVSRSLATHSSPFTLLLTTSGQEVSFTAPLSRPNFVKGVASPVRSRGLCTLQACRVGTLKRVTFK